MVDRMQQTLNEQSFSAVAYPLTVAHVGLRLQKWIVSFLGNKQLHHREANKSPGSLYLSKVTGGTISESEAHQALSRYGALEKVWYCSQTEKEMFRLPEGIWIMFAFFQDCRDAQAVRSSLGIYSTQLMKTRAFEKTLHIAWSNLGFQMTLVPGLEIVHSSRCRFYAPSRPSKYHQVSSAISA